MRACACAGMLAGGRNGVLKCGRAGASVRACVCVHVRVHAPVSLRARQAAMRPMQEETVNRTLQQVSLGSDRLRGDIPSRHTGIASWHMSALLSCQKSSGFAVRMNWEGLHQGGFYASRAGSELRQFHPFLDQ